MTASASHLRTIGRATSGCANLRLRVFGISPEEAGFARRGFAEAEPARQQRLEEIGRTFAYGYNAAILSTDPALISPELNAVIPEQRGFAFEGASMGFALLDILTPWHSRRFAHFMEGMAFPYIYIAYVGAGWALARTSPHLVWQLGPLDPLLRWLMFDGYGFHAGYFPSASCDQRRPRSARPQRLRAPSVRPGTRALDLVRPGG